MRTLAITAFAALAAMLSASLMCARAAGDNYAGDVTDPVSGYPCVTPFCDTIRLPGTSCLCVKVNPNSTRIEELSLACTDMSTRQQCSVSPR